MIGVGCELPQRLLTVLLAGLCAAAAPTQHPRLPSTTTTIVPTGDTTTGSRAASKNMSRGHFVAYLSADLKIQRGAKEIVRFTYEMTGEMATLVDLSAAEPPDGAAERLADLAASHIAGGVIIGTGDQASAVLSSRAMGLGAEPNILVALLGEGTHMVHEISRGDDAPLVVCSGSDETATLYAAYTMLEQLGLRFRLHGDVIPDRLRRASSAAALLRQLAGKKVGPLTPSFDTRGLQPFADFSAGPDWWNEQEFKLTFEQMAKMKFNFLGLHTYPIPQHPVKGPGGLTNISSVCGMLSAPEPTVWVGLDGQFDKQTGQVTTSYPSTFFSTLGFTGNAKGGGLPMNTSDFVFGAGQAFPADAFSSKAMMHSTGNNPGGIPDTLVQSNEIFNLVGGMQSRSFAYARDTLGHKIAVGTEIPLAKPTWLAAGGTPPTTQEYYEAMFARIDATYPIDYYWFWTPEHWEWSKVDLNNSLVTDAVADLLAAAAAKKAVNASFDLATAGWVLGPMGQRNYLDTVLPPEFSALSSIEEELGWFPPDPSFLEVKRKKWTIPCARHVATSTPDFTPAHTLMKPSIISWMEDDGALGEPEFWVSRTIQHAMDARTMDINGLLGIHWRTREVSLQFTAMAMFPWIVTPKGHQTLTTYDVYFDLATADFGMDAPTAMRFAIKAAEYDSFNQLQQRPNGHTHSDPRMNGGGGCSGYSANTEMSANESMSYFGFVDELAAFEPKASQPADKARFDYWLAMYRFGRAEARSWALWGEFERALAAAEVYGASCSAVGEAHCYVDTPSRILPYTVGIDLPTNSIENCAWLCHKANYTIAGVEYASACFCGHALPTTAKSAPADACQNMTCRGNSKEKCGGNYRMSVFAIKCQAPSPVPSAKIDAVMQLRHQLLASVTEQINLLMRTVTTTGSLGTLSDFQQRGLPYMFTAYDDRLEALTGKSLPASAKMPNTYSGVDRLFVMSPRGSVLKTEPYNVTAMAFTKAPLKSVSLFSKVLGADDSTMTEVPLKQVPGRSVWEISLPPTAKDTEFYVGGGGLFWPPGAPTTLMSVIAV